MRVVALVAELATIFAEIDAATAAVAASTGLNCPPGCGRCCDNPAIEAVPLELIPLARRLYAEAACSDSAIAAEARALIAAVQDPDSTWDICRLFEPRGTGLGRCRRYEERPTLCRLFGYSAWADEMGRSRFSACFHHGRTQPEAVQRANLQSMAGLPVPSHEDYEARLQDAAQRHGFPAVLAERHPLNEALRLALETLKI